MRCSVVELVGKKMIWSLFFRSEILTFCKIHNVHNVHNINIVLKRPRGCPLVTTILPQCTGSKHSGWHHNKLTMYILNFSKQECHDFHGMGLPSKWLSQHQQGVHDIHRTFKGTFTTFKALTTTWPNTVTTWPTCHGTR